MCRGRGSPCDGVAAPQINFACTTDGTEPEPTTGACSDLALSDSGNLFGGNRLQPLPAEVGRQVLVTVAKPLTSDSHEEIRYQGTATAYSYVVESYRGSGSVESPIVV